MNSSSVELLKLGVHGSIDRWLRLPAAELKITGTSSLVSLAQLLLQPYSVQPGPHLVVLPRAQDAQKLKQILCFFDPQFKFHELPAFDVGVYSNLYPNRRLIAERLRWLHNAQKAGNGEIFLASVEALLQRTIPFQVLHENTFSISVRQELKDNFADRLGELGYNPSPLVEDVGTFAIRGGIVDIFSPAHPWPFRLELFGDTVDSIRFFDPATQRSLESTMQATVLPAQEIIPTGENRQQAAQALKASFKDRPVPKEEAQAALHALAHGQYLHGMEFLLSYFYKIPSLPVEHFSQSLVVWRHDPIEIMRQVDQLFASLKDEYEQSTALTIRPHFSEVYGHYDKLAMPEGSWQASLSRLQISDQAEEEKDTLNFSTSDLKDFSASAKALVTQKQNFNSFVESKFTDWREQGAAIFIAVNSVSQAQRLRLLLENTRYHGVLTEDGAANWSSWQQEQHEDHSKIHLITRSLPESIRFNQEGVIFLREEDFFGGKRKLTASTAPAKTSEVRTDALNFADLKIGDLIVHQVHGVGIYEGLKVMPIQGVDAELIQLRYKDNDRLYLPVFRVGQIHKFSGPGGTHALDKLGGLSWEKTKTKVRNHLRDVAADLLRIYAERSQLHRPPFTGVDSDFAAFEASFPYEETPDQLRSIGDITKDLTSERPMDRLICGDVGFGKTEVALRAAFKVVQDRKQVAVIAPTTVLTFQHFETFKKRFKDWPVQIKALNRFVSAADTKATLAGLKDGSVDVVVGTHRLFSRDISFKNLGLLIIDEEQKFGVQHKEKIRKLKVGVDTLAMSATPIPRTLNLSLMGIRDLSIINTPPADRLPTRTFVCKYDSETIRKAVESEVARGGQVFFIHNRVESIYALADDLKEFLPNVRMTVAHGQMDESELEKAMIAFFNHEVDMLICTTIIESGMDIPNANTMFIDKAHQLGLSQLYQLRGRVGRSKERAYCYLLIPPDRRLDSDAQERLKVIQENTALGSGIRIAQHDLELRGAGDILGEEQSGHIDAVGYEMYLELLEEAVQTLKGEDTRLHAVEPEINVRIPALIPDRYIPDVRVRLSYYRVLTDIEAPEDMDRIENDLRDQYGAPPEPVINLMGLMLIRHLCKKLAIKDLSSGKTGISLLFTEHTPLPTERVLELTSRANKKFVVSPDSRLHIRISEITWPRIHEELQYLLSIC